MPAPVVRWVALAGRVQVWSTPDFSAQALTSHDPSCVTPTVGVVWVVPEVFRPPTSDAVTSAEPPELR